MNAEIICIGSELLLGETLDTNSAYISKKLAELGIDCNFHTSVGDNFSRVKDCIDIAHSRANIIITTGGLGPTDDDLTIQVITEYIDDELVLDEESKRKLLNFFESIGKIMPESNIRQVYRPKSAKIIPNNKGTAPGIIVERKDSAGNPRIILSFPGVPSELYSMWEETAHNYLKQFSSAILKTRHMKFFGITESELADKVNDLMCQQNPTVAPLVALGEPRLRIAAKAQTEDEALIEIQKVESQIIDRVGEFYYGYDNQSFEEIVSDLLIEKKLTVSVAESCTGGLISSRLTDIAGSSEYIKSNFVTYSNESKTKYLGVQPNIIKNFGVVSRQVALCMAQGVRSRSDASVGLSITGAIGPTSPDDSVPAGKIFIGVCGQFAMDVKEVQLASRYNRIEMKYLACQHALNFLRLFLVKYY